ncbi:MAG TPA: hypothetical protein VGP72_02275 [Planctomycetota bacterium]
MIDRIDTFTAWQHIAGCKSISFEEFSLLKPFGRKGSFPESLVLESCVELSRWLTAASSSFERASVLESIERFELGRGAGCGDVLRITADVIHRKAQALRIACEVCAGNATVASGEISVGLLPLTEGFDADLIYGMWRELYRGSHGSA